MCKKIAVIQPLSNDRLAIWFDDGESRLLDTSGIARRRGARPAIVGAGDGIAWGNTTMDCEEVHKASNAVDFVGVECRRVIAQVAEVRHAAGFSQARLASAAGVKQPVVARLETGVNSPRLDTLIKILTPLGKTIQIVDLVAED